MTDQFEEVAQELVKRSYTTDQPTDRAAVFWPEQAGRLISQALRQAHNKALDEAIDILKYNQERGELGDTAASRMVIRSLKEWQR